MEEYSGEKEHYDVVIVGAGIAGLGTSLGLHRLGIGRILVLESADSLRVTGFALGLWPNAWRALDALGIGQYLRETHLQLTGVVSTSANSGLPTSDTTFAAVPSRGDLNVGCVVRKALLETLANELPQGTIRYSSKVVRIQNQGCTFKSIHLEDGTYLTTKVLIGCDGVNSVVADHLGFSRPSFVGRSAVRGFVHYEDGHGFDPKLFFFFGRGVRYGIIPCNDHGLYWFLTFSPSPQEKGIEEDPIKLKQFILSKLGKVPDRFRAVFERTELESMVCAPLRFRHPWELLWGNISKDGVCLAGDALHPMTPDIGQGACAALEESVILARELAQALKTNHSSDSLEKEQRRIENSLEKYARERRWRSVDLVSTAYMVGVMQQSHGAVMNFLRDKIMAKFLVGAQMKKADFDCGTLTASAS
ncbi:monooxygenase 2-like isoform X2 [Andrographis paniculata]|uniref:monooxygenase 2-like isoform X2 n=1 Tax=Andrographis paniculata TaxID=175694 RepID=UPI0021E81660|nr:monooxygenase 2-like isoform X2 [Andrographis paniculata]